MTIEMFIGIIVFIFLIIAFSKKSNKSRIQEDINAAKIKIETSYSIGEITEAHRNILLERTQIDIYWRIEIDKKIQAFKYLKEHQAALFEKYGNDIGSRLINHQYWIGMTEEQLLDCKGEPDKTERQVLKTKTKETYIYGNKNSGDYFLLENGIVVKFVDR